MFNKLVSRFGIVLLFGLILLTRNGLAQSIPSRESHEVDLAFTYSPTRQSGNAGTTFWQQGGAVELSAEAYRGFGIAMALTGAEAVNANKTGINVNTVTIVFGPRYTYRRARLAVFGESLIGECNGFDGVYPSSQGALSSEASLALQVGGGIDLPLGRHFALRAIEANWLRTQLPNATSNVQNALQLGAGIVFRLR